MRLRHEEPDLEGLLNRLIPNWQSECQGVGDREINELERIACRELPPFYYWFMARMGGSMGSLAYPTISFSAASVIECYYAHEVEPDPRFFLIGVESDEQMGEHLFLDLERPTREDACVVAKSPLEDADEPRETFESFREMLAWGKMSSRGAGGRPQHCKGLFRDPDGYLLRKLDPLMERLGFTSPVASGPYCGLYEGQNGMLTALGSPDVPGHHTFDFAASSAAYIQSTLGKIALETSLTLKIREWDPPLR